MHSFSQLLQRSVVHLHGTACTGGVDDQHNSEAGALPRVKDSLSASMDKSMAGGVHIPVYRQESFDATSYLSVLN
jgi:hypothetical protein